MRTRLYQAVIASAKRSRRVSGGNQAPGVVSAPVINTAVPIPGSPVSFTAGGFSGIPTPTLTQQWLLDGAAISGATNLTYTPVSGDRGHLLSVRQTATNGVGSPANSTSAAVTVAIAPTFSVAPVLIGTPRVGSASSYTSGTYAGTPTPTSSQQWVLNGSDISGATASTYTPVIGNLGGTLTVRQIATNSEGSANSTSSGVVVIAAGTAATIQPPAPVSATGGSGSITGISWVAPGFDDSGAVAAPSSYNLYWGAWSSSTTGTIGPAPNNSGNAGSRTAIAGTSTANITGLTAGQWAIVLTTVNSGGVEGGGSTELIVTVT